MKKKKKRPVVARKKTMSLIMMRLTPRWSEKQKQQRL